MQATAMQTAAEANNLGFKNDGSLCQIVCGLKSGGKYKLDYNLEDGKTISYVLEYEFTNKMPAQLSLQEATKRNTDSR